MGRAKEPKPADIDKFLKLEEDKRNRIINAAMKEFRYGYKKASTDIIVKEAGISKGLLFHYFGTKEQLYAYVALHAANLVEKNHFDIMSRGYRDILELFWQMVLSQKDMCNQYPYLNDFLSSIYIHREDLPNEEMSAYVTQEYQASYERFFGQCDTESLRDDIDHKKAIDTIALTLSSIIEEESKLVSVDGWKDENHERFLETLRGYIDFFRAAFYKQ
ncbi:MAG: TetR/AcrR family transcriptional regulator [Defluviitaleaceae bacterium]|nr:TetR/AcrR family transcriptional regulator [Defluviitaleaceae bacterium]